MKEQPSPDEIIQALIDSESRPLSAKFGCRSDWSWFGEDGTRQEQSRYTGAFEAEVTFVKRDDIVCVRQYDAPTMLGLLLKIRGEA